MLRTCAALAAAAALAVPTGAEAVRVCHSTGGLRPTAVCAGVELNGSGDTVNPTVVWGCTVQGNAVCRGQDIPLGTTGVGSDGHVYVAGRVVL